MSGRHTARAGPGRRRRWRPTARSVSLAAIALAGLALAALVARPAGAAGGVTVTIPVTPPTDHLRLLAPASATAGTAFSLVVRAEDRSNAIAPGFHDTVHFSSTDPSAILPADYTFTIVSGGDNGAHIFSVTLVTAGSQSITAVDTTNPSISGMAGVTISFAAADHFVVQVPANANQGSAFDLTVTTQDRFGNIATGYRGTAHFTSSDPRAVLPANYTFTPADAGVHAFLVPFGVTLRTSGLQIVVATDTASPTITGMAFVNVLVVPLSVTPTSVVSAEGAPFTGIVATFTDPVLTDAPSSYAATIDWGDGVSSSGTITPNLRGGFDVSGSHTYAEEGGYALTVTIADADGSPGTALRIALVADPAVVATPATVGANEGANSGTQTVATFTDPGGPEPVGDYRANIAWGDGSTSVGTITLSETGLYTVTGAHTYADEGAFVITVTIGHDAAPSTTVIGAARVGDPSVAATGGFTLVASEGTLSTGQTVATFTDPGGPEPVANYSATISWGDGSSSAGSIALSAGVYSVTGAHQYAEEGNPAISVTIAHESATPTIASSAASIADPSVVATGGFAFSATEGAASPGQTLATFTDPGGAEAVSDYAATISWGDASISAGTITFAAGVHTVSGAHAYAEEGSPVITVTIAHDATAVVTVSSAASITDPAVVATGGFAFSATEGALSTTQRVATFTDPGGAEAVSDYAATVTWADGLTSSGTITFAAGVYTVGSAHTYAEEGAFAVTVTIAHDAAAPAAVFDAASVADPSVVASGGFTLSATEGTLSTSQTVATFTDPGGPESAANYAATIAWGDGSSSAGTITFDGASVYIVSGAHQYAEEGSPAITVTIAHEAATPAIVTSSAAVNDPGVLLTPTPVSGIEGLDTGAVTVATFTDPGGPEPVADYAAAITWGDGNGSAGTIGYDPATRTFSVTGHNIYKEENTYTVGVTVTHEGAPAAIGQQAATVADAPLTATAGAAITAIVGSPTPTLILATFTDANPYATVADFTATVDWGDGTSSSGTITALGGGFAVSGSHTFATVGPYNVNVTIRDDGGSTAVASLRVTVNGIVIALDRIAEGALSLSGQANLTTSFGVVVNSNSPRALKASGLATLIAGSVSVTGGVRVSGAATVTPAPVTGVPPTPDPYGSLVAPSVAGQVPLGNALVITTATTLQPGLYTGGIRVEGAAAVTLAPGTYVIQGGDLQVSGEATVSGQNVWLVFEASPGSLTCGGVQLTSRASLNLSAATSGTGLGVAIYIDRACSDQGGAGGSSSHGNGIELSGHTTLTAMGAIVVPTREVNAQGQARLEASAIDANTIAADGRAALSAL